MKIAIDASRAINEKAGIGRYTNDLVKSLIKVGKKDHFILIFSYFRKDPKKETEIRKFMAPNVEIRKLKIPGSAKEQIWGWNLSYYNQCFRGADVLLASSFFEFKLGLKIPQVVIVHDMTTFLFPSQRGKRVSERLSKRAILACKNSQKIIAISESTKKDIQKFAGVKEKDIVVCYPGLTEFNRIAKTLPQGLKPQGYILSVGTLEPRKNIRNLLLAYNLLPNDLRQKYKLVICGAKGWNTPDEVKKITENKNILWLGYTRDDTLAKLYKEAKVFVYPSLYEGFGIPIIEAMSFGTPVITSNISSMPEAAQGAATLINPKDPKEISLAMKSILGERKIKDTKLKARRFSWVNTAKEILAILKEAR